MLGHFLRIETMSNNKQRQVVDFTNPNADKIISASTQTQMSNNKQSSVDILCQKLANKLGLQAITFYIDHAEEIAEAKAMHKEEIIEFAINFTYGTKRVGGSIKKDFIKLYNETYGGSND